MSKPMIFQNDKAFNFLKENGFVFTFRKGQSSKIVERVWVRRSRTGEKCFDAIKVYEEYEPRLTKYVEWSGFEDTIEWTNAIQELYGKGYIGGTVYLVFRVKEER